MVVTSITKPRSGVVPKVQMMFMKKGVLRVMITPKYDKTKSRLDLRFVPWTDEMGN